MISKLSLSSKFVKTYSWTFKRIMTQLSNLDEFGKTHIEFVRKCLPLLTDNNKHKGQDGRIGIIGGSIEYTGAPYFAAISALKIGADLVHIFCSSAAAPVIKSYSPELIVHPLLDEKNAVTKISPWLDRLHVIVIGPGLGREPDTFKVVTDLILLIKLKKIPLIIDADALFLITEKFDLIKDFVSPVILTPNKAEFDRLNDKVYGGAPGIANISASICVLRKGKEDEMFNQGMSWKCGISGSGRRCGGQGDILADRKAAASSLACYAACCVVRTSNRKALQMYHRSMLATDMIKYLPESFRDFFIE